MIQPHMGHQEIIRRRLIKILFLVLAGAGSTYFIFNQFLKNEQIFYPNRVMKNTTAVENTQIEAGSLKGVVDNALEGSEGTYGIAIKSLKNKQSYYANEHRVFEAGSLYKLWVMAVVYQQIREGKLTEDQVLSQDVAVLNQEFDIDPDWAELTEGTVTLTVQDALGQMIAISHNYAALLLMEKIEPSSVTVFLQENGLTESTMGINGGPPTTTAYDTALFLEKLYKGQLANTEDTRKMIELLKRQALNDKLPKYLPKSIVVAHKTGETGWFSHDAGIVFTDKGDYIITVMSESDFPPGAQERIALMSKGVFEYFKL